MNTPSDNYEPPETFLVPPTSSEPGYQITHNRDDYWDVYKLWIDETGERYDEHMGSVLTAGLALYLAKAWMD